MCSKKRLFVALICAMSVASALVLAGEPHAGIQDVLKQSGAPRGICVVLGLPQVGQSQFVMDLARDNEWTFYFQSQSDSDVAAVRQTADVAGLLGKRIFAARGEKETILLADNLADILIDPTSAPVTQDEALRVVHPGGCIVLNGNAIHKPAPPGLDDWSHPCHGPDNNLSSTDQQALAPYLTQFTAEPFFGASPEIAVAAGGRIFRAYGNWAQHAYENPMLNTLLAINGYNGSILWRRSLKDGFMIQRNTLIATPQFLYMGDDESCKVLDAASGKQVAEIIVPDGVADGKVWKWMAMEGNCLYALVGAEEVQHPVKRGEPGIIGNWGPDKWPYHFKDPKTNPGFGRTFLAIDPQTKKILWQYRQDAYIDSRGTCMRHGKIYFYTHKKALGCLDAKTGKIIWTATDPQLLETADDFELESAEGGQWKFFATPFIACNDRYVFYAGIQNSRILAISAEDGKIVWQKEFKRKSKNGEVPDHFHLVLRDEALYAIGGAASYKLDYPTGNELAKLSSRAVCARATGSQDSVFYRAAMGSTVRYDVKSGDRKAITPMRPSCNSGVLVANGLLYWGPWMCGCNIALFGQICLGPANKFDFHPKSDESRLERGPGLVTEIKEFKTDASDSPYCRQAPLRSIEAGCLHPGSLKQTPVVIPADTVRFAWSWPGTAGGPVTPAVTTGGLLFFGQSDGTVCALDAVRGKLVWKAYTGGQIKSAPAIWNSRLYVGAGDGWVYAYEAATGRQLWRFRPGPAERRIPFYGRLISTWPVAGGVVVQDGVVYAAAGITDYDGTYVVALDAVAGKIKWQNDTSSADNVMLGGPLYVDGSNLCFAAGNMGCIAPFDLETGKYKRKIRWETDRSLFNIPDFQAYQKIYRLWGQYLPFPDGHSICINSANKWSFNAPPVGTSAAPPPTIFSTSIVTQVWSQVTKTAAYNYNFVLSKHALLMVSESESAMAPHSADPSLKDESHVMAFDLQDGKPLWTMPLPSKAVEGGLVVDRDGRVMVSLMDGQVICFER